MNMISTFRVEYLDWSAHDGALHCTWNDPVWLAEWRTRNHNEDLEPNQHRSPLTVQQCRTITREFAGMAASTEKQILAFFEKTGVPPWPTSGWNYGDRPSGPRGKTISVKRDAEGKVTKGADGHPVIETTNGVEHRNDERRVPFKELRRWAKVSNAIIVLGTATKANTPAFNDALVAAHSMGGRRRAWKLPHEQTKTDRQASWDDGEWRKRNHEHQLPAGNPLTGGKWVAAQALEQLLFEGKAHIGIESRNGRFSAGFRVEGMLAVLFQGLLSILEIPEEQIDQPCRNAARCGGTIPVGAHRNQKKCEPCSAQQKAADAIRNPKRKKAKALAR
jgi:hypothetical protein